MVLLHLWAYRDFKHFWCYGMEQVCGLDAAVAAALPCTTYGSGKARRSAWIARRYRKNGTAHGQVLPYLSDTWRKPDSARVSH